MRLAAMTGAAVVLGLAGCSGSDGGGGGAGPAPFPPAPSAFAAHAADGAAIGAEIEGLAFTDPASLPQSGEATYTGQIGVYADNSPVTPSGALRADLRVEADFEDNAISATAANWVTGEDVQLAGEVRFEGGTIFPDADVETEYTFATDTVDGTLTTPAGVVYEADSGGLRGDFLGTRPGHVAGEAQLLLGVRDGGVYQNHVGGFEARQD